MKKLLNQPYIKALSTGYLHMASNILVQLLLIPLYLRFLGKEQFGILMMILSFFNYAAIGIGWMSGGCLRVLSEQFAQKDLRSFYQYFAASRFIYVAYAMLVAGVSCFYFLIIAAPETLSVYFSWELVGLCALYFVLQYDLAIERIAYNSLNQQHIGNLFQSCSLILFALLVIPTLYFGGQLIEVMVSFCAAIGIARVASWFNLWFGTFRHLESRWSDFNLVERCRPFFSRMGAGYLAYGVIILTMQADILIVGWIGGPEAAADFVLIWKIPNLIIQILWKIPEFLQPQIIYLDKKKEFSVLKSLYDKAFNRTRWLALLAALCYAFLGKSIIELWTQGSDIPEDPMLYVLAAGGIYWLATARVPAVFASALLRFRFLIRLSLLEVVSKLLVMIMLFPILGLAAPLFAINLTHVLGIGFLYRRFGLVAATDAAASGK